ncbi:uncharacterized protein ACNS7B_021240 isoform 2-T2 [Menidia menidia]
MTLQRMKRLCRILLLLLSACVCASAFGVNVTQRHHQAEETHSITLEWTFTTHPHRPWKYLMAYCELLTEHTGSLLAELIHDGDHLTESVGEQFSGRVQMDRDALGEGRIRLQVSRLRPEDSGWFQCYVRTDHGLGSESCRLDVTAAAAHPKIRRSTKGSEPGSQEPGSPEPGSPEPGAPEPGGQEPGGPEPGGPEPGGPEPGGPEPGRQDYRSRIGLFFVVVTAALLIMFKSCFHLIKASNETTETNQTFRQSKNEINLRQV